MAVPDQSAVLEAMRSDLGVRRVDDLDLANGRPGSSARPGQAGRIVAIPPPPPRKVLPLANKWKDAIARGEFDDEDADAVKNLDKIGGGRLHAQNKPPTGTSNFTARPKGYPPPFSAGMPRMPGAYPPTPDKSTRGAPTGHYKSSMGMTSMGIVPNGPVQRFSSSSSPARHSVNIAHQRPLPTNPPQATPSRPFGTRPLQHHPSTLPRSPMPPTPPRDVSTEPQVVTRPKDPEPPEYFYKADIRVGDRLAKGQGTVYLLESSPTDTGTMSIYLEGSRYLEYPVLSMYNYITNSEELCPQFKEPDGASITTTSLVFGSQEKMVDFMKAIRTLKARKSLSSVKPASNSKPQTSTEPTADAGGCSRQKESTASTVPAKGPAIEEDRKHDHKNDVADINKQSGAPTSAEITNPPPPKQPQVPSTQTANEKPLLEEAPTKAAVCEITNDLLDLSLPVQVPSDRAMHASQFSPYALDLGSLELPACNSIEPRTDAAKEETQVAAVDTSNEASAPEASVEGAVESFKDQNAIVLVNQDAGQTENDAGETSQDVDHINQEIDQMTHVQLVSAIENLRDYLIDILPTFEDMCRVLVSVDAADRQIVAKTVYASIRDSSHGDLAECEASAKQVLLALLSQAGHLEKMKTIEARPDNRTKYTPEEILQLRTKALPPPPQLSKFTNMLRTEKYATPQPAPTGKNSVQSRQQNINPKKTAAVPPPRANPSHEREASLQRNNAKAPISHHQDKGFNPKAPVFTASHVDSITAALAAVSLTGAPMAIPTNGSPAALPQEDQKPKPAAGPRVKGLLGSRWATDAVVLPTNANHFTGINIP